MKLAPLLAQYLYDQKKLDLPGIGIFLLDPSARTSTDAQHFSEGISFEYNAAVKEDEDLVSYITTQTGKMKALASSDLSSYTELGIQFLNIGKPFQIEGIGTLVKRKNGEFQFTADHLLIDKVKETGIKELSATSISDGSMTTYENLKPNIEKSPTLKRIFLTFLALATIAVIIYAGYRTNKRNSPDAANEEKQATNEAIPVGDTTKYISRATDTLVSVKQPIQTANNGSYHFVIEVANKKRAFYRYNILKKGQIPIQMSTSDSINFKLFFVLAATPADTARMSDSLTTWYPSINHRKTFAE